MKTHYFASANSYNGFLSLFGEIFNRKKFERTFILKGGPGTGKSTFMKKVAKEMEAQGANIEYYYCSSDIDSLDAVIISLNGKKFAIMDGTSPHENDAIYVGAVDEIINLGSNVDYDWIRTYKEKIIVLSDQKSEAYKNAYSYLSIAGECDKHICKAKMKSFDFKSADKYIEGLEKYIDFSIKHTEEKKFISSFSKNGYKSFELAADKKIKIGGGQRESILLISYMNNALQIGKKEVFPTPLNFQNSDAIRFGENFAIQYDGVTYDINSASFFDQSASAIEGVRTMQSIYQNSIDKAKRWFTIASDMHFRLEEIYQKCMNFDKNEEKLVETNKKILKLCDYDS